MQGERLQSTSSQSKVKAFIFCSLCNFKQVKEIDKCVSVDIVLMSYLVGLHFFLTLERQWVEKMWWGYSKSFVFQNPNIRTEYQKRPIF